MAKLIQKKTLTLSDAGDTKRVTVKRDWLPVLGLEDKEKITTALYYSEKHDGFFLAAFDSENQPSLEDLDLEKLDEELTEKVDIVDES